MKELYQFHSRQEAYTPIEIVAESEQEARELIAKSDDSMIIYKTIVGDTWLELVHRKPVN